MFAVFLDIDGVLNTRSTVQSSPEGHTGIDDARVEILSNAIAKYGGAKIIITSDWKNKRIGGDYKYLEGKLAKFGLEIADKSYGLKFDRGAGVQSYLLEHPEIDEYVILDDNTFDFDMYPKLWERLLLTSGIENAKCVADTPAVEAMIFLDYIKLL